MMDKYMVICLSDHTKDGGAAPGAIIAEYDFNPRMQRDMSELDVMYGGCSLITVEARPEQED